MASINGFGKGEMMKNRRTIFLAVLVIYVEKGESVCFTRENLSDHYYYSLLIVKLLIFLL